MSQRFSLFGVRLTAARLGVWALSVLALTGLLLTYHHLAVVALGGSASIGPTLITEGTAALGLGILFWGVLPIVMRWPLWEGRRLRRLGLYLAVLVLFSVLHTLWNWGTRNALFPLTGYGEYWYGNMSVRFFMEAPMDVIAFSTMVAAIHGGMRVRMARERELVAARLEHRLSEAKLENLRLQLQPHFLFNALNTVSSVMYRDPEAADRVLERLGDLLRASLDTARGDEVELARELELLEAYLEIMRARFGDRLATELVVPEEALDVRVPSMLLQPLFENAIRHGGLESEGRGHVRLEVTRHAEALELVVEDDGPGAPEGVDPLAHGLGLSATRERVRLLYGEAARFEAGNGPRGGFRVAIRIPAESARDAVGRREEVPA